MWDVVEAGIKISNASDRCLEKEREPGGWRSDGSHLCN